MNRSFRIACDMEITKNAKKGDWRKWKPSRKMIIKELLWHVAKLSGALLTLKLTPDSINQIREHSCDIANYCEKIYVIAVQKHGAKVEEYDSYHDFCGYTYNWPLADKDDKDR